MSGHRRSAIPAPLLERMLADYASDEPRLVYADQLSERGDPLGDFIRADIAFEHSPTGSPERERFRLQRDAVLETNRARWTQGIVPLVAYHRFFRGFIHGVDIAAPKLVAHWDQLWEEAPLLTHLSLQTVPHAPLSVDAAERLARVPYLAQVGLFSSSTSIVYPEACRTLLGSDRWRVLRSLHLRAEPLRDEGAVIVAESHELTNLGLTACQLGPEGAEALASSPRLRGMRLLTLSDNPLRDAGARAIADGDWRLRQLTLRSTELGDDGVECLAACDALADVQWLDISHNPIGDRGARALCDARFADDIEVLYVVQTALSASAERALRQRYGQRAHLL